MEGCDQHIGQPAIIQMRGFCLLFVENGGEALYLRRCNLSPPTAQRGGFEELFAIDAGYEPPFELRMNRLKHERGWFVSFVPRENSFPTQNNNNDVLYLRVFGEGLLFLTGC
ncbi:hypothetical protein [Asticcacaulis excentricus]|uniref:hypothetical protein n=1 Tax=Asticcacaulis excentricus TaxID=78587 RepID=UPI0001A76FCC|nr:hypothetical protein [Asticcacaulis excentricus]